MNLSIRSAGGFLLLSLCAAGAAGQETEFSPPGKNSAEERDAVVRELLALQKRDGGWCLPSFGGWKRHDDTPNAKDAPGDGYATGLAIFVLRTAGLPAEHARIKRGVDWLKANQRESGRWFTKSLSIDDQHFLTHVGTAYAVMALDACGELP